MRFRHVILLAVLAALVGCKQKKVQARLTVEESPVAAPALASTVHTGDPKSAGQLVAGFYGIEAGAWRWTARSFAVALHTPAGSLQKGAVLQFKFTVPAVSIEKLGSLTLSASVNGAALAPQTISSPASHTYQRDVPPGVLTGDTVRVEFQLDKALVPGQTDLRELGVVALSAGLEAK
jgi:hypothetical protein